MSGQQKWTKGPWVALGYDPNADEVCIEGGGGEYVCSVDCDGLFAENIDPTIGANTKLIAAAPDLYDALENLMSELEDIRGISVAEYKVDAWNIAKSALAKARGENE